MCHDWFNSGHVLLKNKVVLSDHKEICWVMWKLQHNFCSAVQVLVMPVGIILRLAQENSCLSLKTICFNRKSVPEQREGLDTSVCWDKSAVTSRSPDRWEKWRPCLTHCQLPLSLEQVAQETSQTETLSDTLPLFLEQVTQETSQTGLSGDPVWHTASCPCPWKHKMGGGLSSVGYGTLTFWLCNLICYAVFVAGKISSSSTALFND